MTTVSDDELIARLRLEAQSHAQEARTANATIYEIYRAVTGGTGEPGNWHGAEPVKKALAERDALIRSLSESKREMEKALEPFAKAANSLSSRWFDHERGWDIAVVNPTVGDLRRARAVIAKEAGHAE